MTNPKYYFSTHKPAVFYRNSGKLSTALCMAGQVSLNNFPHCVINRLPWYRNFVFDMSLIHELKRDTAFAIMYLTDLEVDYMNSMIDYSISEDKILPTRDLYLRSKDN